MGVPRYLCASAVSAVVAQRLVRRVCRSCSVMAPLAADEQAWIAYWAELETGEHGMPFPVLDRGPRAVGCPACGGTGFHGRMAIQEVVVWDDDLRGTILQGGTESELRAVLRAQGVASLAADGVAKARAGLTTVGEIMRVLGGDLG
jgi:type IV pilus assembly protein PilB